MALHIISDGDEASTGLMLEWMSSVEAPGWMPLEEKSEEGVQVLSAMEVVELKDSAAEEMVGLQFVEVNEM